MIVNHYTVSEEVGPGGGSTSARSAAHCRTKQDLVTRNHAWTAGCQAALPTDLAHNEIHLWHRTRWPLPAEGDRLYALLSSEEQHRLPTFALERQRLAFVAVRGTLRALLGHYLDLPPASVRFRYGPDGKPHLDHPGVSLCFNVTHAGQWIWYALSRETDLGVDLEEIRPAPPAKRLHLARRFFASAEAAALAALPTAQVNEAFFACWTRKEAYIKRHGASLARLLTQFTVSVDPAQPARLLATPWQPADVDCCQLHDLPAPAGYRAALALAATTPFSVCRWPWPETI
ncbi:MAG: 4'-phosphopantetheinyl transferase superfamily protein [Magnetococcales bacterium]|nr:4'-phosphopantetheinyl transferase superfamily protein [Magnetococcales bacterium]